jgi:hypothetical protein
MTFGREIIGAGARGCVNDCSGVDLLASWTGHSPITTKVLMSLFERAAVGDYDFSQDERALYLASEFWAATVANELSGHLGADPISRLQGAGLAFLKIGATALSHSIFKGIDELRRASIGTSFDECVGKMERGLQMTLDPVDLLLAQFAEHCAALPIEARHPSLHLGPGPAASP